jgi:hypothetical protein
MAEKISNKLENSFKNNEDAHQSYVHHLVWLDKNIENDVNQQKLNQLHELDDQIKTFASKKQCIDYIQRQNDRNTKSYIIFIISGSLSKEVIPEIHDYTCILAIFIFCTKSEQVQHLTFPKIRLICTDTNELIVRIRNYMNRDKISIDFSLFNNQNAIDTGNFNVNILEEYQLILFFFLNFYH